MYGGNLAVRAMLLMTIGERRLAGPSAHIPSRRPLLSNAPGIFAIQRTTTLGREGRIHRMAPKVRQTASGILLQFDRRSAHAHSDLRGIVPGLADRFPRCDCAWCRAAAWHPARKEFVLAALASVLMLLIRASTPHVAFPGRVPGTNTFSDLARQPDNQEVPNVIAFSPEASLLYVNTESVLEVVLKRVIARPYSVRLVICDPSASPHVDLAGSRMLHELHDKQADLDIGLRIVPARGWVRGLLRANGLCEKVGELDRLITLQDLVVGSANSGGQIDRLSETRPEVRREREAFSTCGGRTSLLRSRALTTGSRGNLFDRARHRLASTRSARYSACI